MGFWEITSIDHVFLMLHNFIAERNLKHISYFCEILLTFVFLHIICIINILRIFISIPFIIFYDFVKYDIILI